jgi:hypothetical protein
LSGRFLDIGLERGKRLGHPLEGCVLHHLQHPDRALFVETKSVDVIRERF